MLEHTLPSCERFEMAEQERNPLPIFKAKRASWLVEGEPSPFNHIHKLLNYGLAASKDMKTRSRVRWSADNKRIYFDGQGMEIERWQNFVHDLLKRAEEIMSQHLLFDEHGDIQKLDLNRIIDNPNRRDSGYYFALENPNAVRQSRQKMLGRLERSKIFKKMIQRNGKEACLLSANHRRVSGIYSGGNR